MRTTKRTRMLEQIKQNIEGSGFHLYIITGEVVPRFAYTIGLRESLGADLVMAGGLYYMGDDIKRIVHTILEQITAGKAADSVFRVDGQGFFTLRAADHSWTKSLMIGAIDYYEATEVNGLQIVPDEIHRTIDVPDMSKGWSATAEPVWQWLHEDWNYDVPRASTVTTNLDALRGAPVTEVTRWKADEWEMFAGAGPEVSDEAARVVPLGCLLAADPSLAPALSLEIGTGLWREGADTHWNPWGSSLT